MINAPHAHLEKIIVYSHISTSPKSFVELPSYSCYLFVDLSVLEAYSDICAEISEMLRTSTNTTCDSASQLVFSLSCSFLLFHCGYQWCVYVPSLHFICQQPLQFISSLHYAGLKERGFCLPEEWRVTMHCLSTMCWLDNIVSETPGVMFPINFNWLLTVKCQL